MKTLAEKSIRERIAVLRETAEAELKACGGHMITNPEEQEAYARIAGKVYAGNVSLPAIRRKAEFLRIFAEEFPITIRKHELLVGSQRFTHPDWNKFLSEQQLKAMNCAGNMGHIVVDYGRVIHDGISKIRESIEGMPQSVNRHAFGESLDAFARFIERHAEALIELRETMKKAEQEDADRQIEICRHIAKEAPRSFREALQLLWFVQVFMHAESDAAAVSFGRFDQYLGSFLEKDLADGIISRGEAEELLGCFFLKCCEGDESQNLIVGGIDEAGENAENQFSFMVLKVAAELKVWQPSISVRIAPSTSEKFWRHALELCQVGIGMPSFFNDPIVIEALKKLEVSEERARDWSVVGCYEAAPQGDACPMTVAGGISLPDIFLDYFSESEAEDFDSFFSDFKNYFNRRYIKKLSEFQSNWDRMSVDKASPFESVCLTGCIESGKAAEAGGAKYNFYGVNVLGIGTLVDSLLAVREIVYETRKLSLAEFKKEVRENFPDKKLLNLCRNMPGKYGSGQGLSNLIAGDISRHIVRTILFRPLENGVRPYPGFFWFGRDIHALIPATPDGRRDNELISYGAGPGLLCSEGDISSILRSVAELPNDFCACGNPLILSFNRKDISGEEGAERLKQVIKTYFSAGGFHLHINITDAEQLRKIQQDDSEQPDLTVRISGYSAKFSGIDRKWQDAVIERTEKGM